jgi:hypothetical protein
VDRIRDRWHATLVRGHSLLGHEIGGIKMALLLMKCANDAAVGRQFVQPARGRLVGGP